MIQYHFIEELPNNLHGQPILISWIDSLQFHQIEYLLIKDRNMMSIYEIRYKESLSPFKDALIRGDMLAVGHQDYFYLFDLTTNKHITKLRVWGYFGSLYREKEYIYIADSYWIYCINKYGKVLWENKELGIDGVIINKFTKDEIHGEWEWDPPNGWQRFIVNKHTGKWL